MPNEGPRHVGVSLPQRRQLQLRWSGREAPRDRARRRQDRASQRRSSSAKRVLVVSRRRDRFSRIRAHQAAFLGQQPSRLWLTHVDRASGTRGVLTSLLEAWIGSNEYCPDVSITVGSKGELPPPAVAILGELAEELRRRPQTVGLQLFRLGALLCPRPSQNRRDSAFAPIFPSPHSRSLDRTRSACVA
jgi:hypothetical protein